MKNYKVIIALALGSLLATSALNAQESPRKHKRPEGAPAGVRARHDVVLIGTRRTPAAHDHYLRLKSQKLRIGTRDLRIASIALAHGATLITRNRRDFDIVPSLQLEVWN